MTTLILHFWLAIMRHFVVQISMGFMLTYFNALLRSKLRHSKFVCWEFRTIFVYIFYSETNALNHTSFGLIYFTTHVYWGARWRSG